VARANLLELGLLRYRLLWAYVRSSPTRIAFSAALVFLLGIAILLAILAGMGGLAAAARRELAETVARIILGGMFLNALVASVMLGFGMKQAFSEATLRRYPLSRAERLVIRHGLGLVEPLWLMTLAVYLGAAAGASLQGVAPIWLTAPAALLLLVINHLLARLIVVFGDWLSSTAVGSFALLVLFQGFFLLPLALGQPAVGDAYGNVLLRVFSGTPPAAAAALMAGTSVLPAAALLVVWAFGIGAAVVWLESRPASSRTASARAARWDTLHDRIASVFPGAFEPLVGRGLRYYLRRPRTRINLLVVLPLLALIVFRTGSHPASLFEQALLFAPIMVPILFASLSFNVFGCEGSGLRRVLLGPLTPSMILRAIGLVPLLIGTAYVIVGATLWQLLAPVPTSPRMLVMLVAHALTGMVLFHAVALGSSVLVPKKVPYEQKYRDDMSIGAHVLLFVGIIALLAVPTILRATILRGPIEQYWWVPALALALSLVLYELALRGASRMLALRRERLLSVVEGRG
jgi:hypothetical protein